MTRGLRQPRRVQRRVMRWLRLRKIYLGKATKADRSGLGAGCVQRIFWGGGCSIKRARDEEHDP